VRFHPCPEPGSFRLAGFRDVDASGDPAAYIGFLDRVATDFGEMVETGIDLLQLKPGGTVLDVGCGHGAMAPVLASRVGAAGSVKGIDLSRELVAEARRRFEASGLPIDIRVGDAQALAFAEASVDAARADRVLIFVPDPGAVVKELARVTKPGGRVVVSEADIGAGIVDSPDVEVTREVLTAVGEEFANPWIGRQLRARFVEAGLLDVEARLFPVLTTCFAEWRRRMGIDDALDRAVASGRVPRQRGEAWLEELSDRDSRGRFLASSVFFMVAGTRP
jgi:ubiquinone/menaquinone biosynthesis C-methylase UbiE